MAASALTGSWPAKATTSRTDPDFMDGHYLTVILSKDNAALKPWDHCIRVGQLDAANGIMPPFFRDLRSDQAGHLFAYVLDRNNRAFSMRNLGFFYPANFDVGGQPLSRKKNWGAAYDGDATVKKKIGNKTDGYTNVDIPLDTIFDSGGRKPVYTDVYPPTYTSCWRRMPTMPASMTYTVVAATTQTSSTATPTPASVVPAKRKFEVDLDIDIADAASDIEAELGKKASAKALMQLVLHERAEKMALEKKFNAEKAALETKINDEKAALETKINDEKAASEHKMSLERFEMRRVKKAAERSSHYQRCFEGTQKSRDFYKDLLGDVLNQAELAQTFLEQSLENAETSVMEGEDWLDVDDSDYEYDGQGMKLGPVRDSYSAKNRRTNFIEDTLIGRFDEEFHMAVGDEGFRRYNLPDKTVKPTKKAVDGVIDLSSSESSDGEGGVSVVAAKAQAKEVANLQKALSASKKKARREKRKAAEFQDGLKKIHETLSTLGLDDDDQATMNLAEKAAKRNEKGKAGDLLTIKTEGDLRPKGMSNAEYKLMMAENRMERDMNGADGGKENGGGIQDGDDNEKAVGDEELSEDIEHSHGDPDDMMDDVEENPQAEDDKPSLVVILKGVILKGIVFPDRKEHEAI